MAKRFTLRMRSSDTKAVIRGKVQYAKADNCLPAWLVGVMVREASEKYHLTPKQVLDIACQVDAMVLAQAAELKASKQKEVAS